PDPAGEDRDRLLALDRGDGVARVHRVPPAARLPHPRGGDPGPRGAAGRPGPARAARDGRPLAPGARGDDAPARRRGDAGRLAAYFPGPAGGGGGGPGGGAGTGAPEAGAPPQRKIWASTRDSSWGGNDSSAALPPTRTILRRRSRSEVSCATPTCVQPR